MQLNFKDFKEFIDLYNPGEYFYEKSKHFRIGIAGSESGFKNTSYVNSVHTKDGGTHVDYIINQLISQLREMIEKKHKIHKKERKKKEHTRKNKKIEIRNKRNNTIKEKQENTKNN